MKPRILLDTAPLPDGGELQLFKRDTEFSIMLGNIELMNSRNSRSEEALATLVCERLKDTPAPKLLIGGLGMGFTLRAALAAFPAQSKLIVAELVPQVIAWARTALASIHGDSLDDPRVTLYQGDVAAAIAGENPFDAILLDVDNGPDGLSRPQNDRLYSANGLAIARAALRPGGHLAVWSSAPDAHFTRRLKQSGMAVAEVPVRATRSGKGARHHIWFATRPGRPV